jgi:hypothetical protein
MKKIILIALMVILCLPVKAQEKFNGIGIFKIGMDTSTLISYANQNSYSIKNCSDFTEYIQYKNDNFKLLVRLYHHDDNSLSIPSVSSNPYVSNYLITLYYVSGLTINNIELTFYKNALIQFTVKDNFDIDKGMEEKYGKGSVEILHLTSQCLDDADVDRSYFTTWKNGKIKAYRSILEQFDENCQKSYNSSFTYFVDNKELDKWNNEIEKKSSKLLKNPEQIKDF